MNEKDIWDLVLERLKNAHGFSPMALELWFDGMIMEKLTPDVAYFSTDNALKKNIVESKYADVLKQDLKEVLGFDVRVVIVSREKQSFAEQFDELYANIVAGREPVDAEREKEDAVDAVSDNVFLSPSLSSGLPEYTFDNFVVGGSNNMAYTLAKSVAEHPAVIANPLFLYGAPGLGKTHLLYAITREISEKHPEYSIIYAKGEDFMNELVEALANKTPILFREKYRNADVLMLDDIQFISGKVSVQEEFFHTYEALFEAGKQIIVTADRLPKDIQSLAERLRSRFEHGIIADIQPPDLELRVAIFKRKAQMLGITVPNNVLMYLGENIKDNIRQIEGALKKMRASAIIQGTEINMEHAKNAVNDILTAKAAAISPEKVIEYISQKYQIPYEDILGRRKTDNVVMARQVAMYLLRELTVLSLANIGKAFNRDHSTVVNAINRVNEMMEEDCSFEAQVEDMIKDMQAVGY